MRLKNSLVCSVFLIVLSVFIFVSVIPVYPNASIPTTTLYLDPLCITATSAGQTFTVNINVADVTNLFGWDLAIEWDPTILECTKFEEGPFLSDAGATLEFPGTIDNVAGRIDPPWGIILSFGTTFGVNGSGTLAIATFESKKAGVTAPHLLLGGVSNLIDFPFSNYIYFKVIDVFPVVEGVDIYYVGMVRGNSTIENFAFNQSEEELSFNATEDSMDIEMGFFNVTIPKSLMSPGPTEEWKVLFDGTEVTPTITENATHTSIYVAYSHSAHKVQIKVSVPPEPPHGPTANFTYSPSEPHENQIVTFNASTSLPGWNGTHEASIADYAWDFGDGNVTTVTAPIITHSYTTADNYTVILNVSDSQGFWNTTSKTVTVSQVIIHSPTAVFSYSPIVPSPGETVTFDASDSLPGWNGTADSPIANYTWDFGDNTTDTGMIVNHIYDDAGVYEVILNVTDSQGFWNATLKTITVSILPTGYSWIDPLGDTQPWSTNATIVAMGNTSETDAEFDAARDIKAFWMIYDDETVWFRIYVKDLVDDDSLELGAMYQIHISTRVWIYGQTDCQRDGRTFVAPEAAWERSIGIAMENYVLHAWMVDTLTGPRYGYWRVIDDTNSSLHQLNPILSAMGNMTLEANFTDNYVQISAPWRDLMVDGQIPETLNITVMSFKPGEWLSYPQPWDMPYRTAFDPGAPGTNGDEWNNFTRSPMLGPDAADVMPGNQSEIDWNCWQLIPELSDRNQSFEESDMIPENTVDGWLTVEVIFPPPWIDEVPPVADAGPDQTVDEDTLVTFDGSNSTDDFGITSYTWAFMDVALQTLTGVDPTYIFATPGTYVVTLNVTDAADNWATDTVTIIVLDKTPPTADAGSDQVVGQRTTVTFDGNGSTDNVGIADYTWFFTDGTLKILTGVDPAYTFNNYGNFQVTLNVSDYAGNWNVDTMWVNVTDTTPPLIGPLSREPESPDAMETVMVSGNVTDAESGVQTVILSFTIDGGFTWVNITITLPIGDIYIGEIPGLPAGTTVQYKIIAYDKAGNWAVYENGEYYTYTIIPEFPNWASLLLVFLVFATALVALNKRRVKSNKSNEQP